MYPDATQYWWATLSAAVDAGNVNTVAQLQALWQLSLATFGESTDNRHANMGTRLAQLVALVQTDTATIFLETCHALFYVRYGITYVSTS